MPSLKAAAVSALFALCAGSATAQDKVVRIIVAYGAGGGSDIVARLLAEKMRASLGLSFIVENKTGAAGVIGTEAVKSADPDGTTILLSPLAPMVMFPHSHARLSYDPFKDFAPIAHVNDFQLALAVGAQVPAANLKEFAAFVKKDPKNVFYSSPAAGSIPHYVGVMFSEASGLSMTHVPYKGGAAVVRAMLGGEISAGVSVLSDFVPHTKSGKLKVLAVAGGSRSPHAPDVPTLKESGYDIEGKGWYALFAPAKTPKDVIDRYAKASLEAIKSKDFIERLNQMGLEPTGFGPGELATIVKRDFDRWGPIVKKSGFRVDD